MLGHILFRFGIALFTIAILFTTFSLTWAAGDHADGVCPAQSWSSKTGATTFWWKAVTACNDHPAEELVHDVFLQVWDWDESRWRDMTFVIYGESHFNVSFIAASRFRQVTPFGGIACYRVRVHHFVYEHSKFLLSDGNSYSLGQCY